MIRRNQDLKTDFKNIRGGVGEIAVTELLKGDEFCNKGRLFAKMVIKPGDSVGDHLHAGDFEAYYIIKGEGKYIENNEEKRLYPGDMTLTKDGEGHSLINDGKEDIELIALVLFSK